TIELAARHLHDQGIERLIVANRTLERAQHLAHELSGFAISLDEIGEHLYEADVVVSSTGASEPVLLRETVAEALHRRRHRPMFLVDLAVPRDIEEQVAELEDVYHYTIDDLEAVVAEGLESRRAAAAQAEEIIQTEAAHFIEWLHGQDAVSTIRALRGRFEASREEVLRRARRALERGEDPASVLETATRQLANKLAHAPSVRLRQAMADERAELLDAARELFDLRDPE
ncbi:MAG: glutamyl-tRNA reductase, partial [Gammaproteobacteria bacterium]